MPCFFPLPPPPARRISPTGVFEIAHLASIPPHKINDIIIGIVTDAVGLNPDHIRAANHLGARNILAHEAHIRHLKFNLAQPRIVPAECDHAAVGSIRKGDLRRLFLILRHTPLLIEHNFTQVGKLLCHCRRRFSALDSLSCRMAFSWLRS